MIARAASEPDPEATTERSVPLEIADAAFATRTEPGLGAGSGTSTTWVFPPRKTTCFTAVSVSGAKAADRLLYLWRDGQRAEESCRSSARGRT